MGGLMGLVKLVPMLFAAMLVAVGMHYVGLAFSYLGEIHHPLTSEYEVHEAVVCMVAAVLFFVAASLFLMATLVTAVFAEA
jgi:hypothetical protein